MTGAFWFWKTAHILSATILLGAGLAIAFFCWFGYRMASAWSIVAWGLYFFVGLCWLPVVAIQIMLKTEAGRVSSVEELPAHFHRWFNRWFALGVPAFAAVVLLFYLMVAKPLPLT